MVTITFQVSLNSILKICAFPVCANLKNLFCRLKHQRSLFNKPNKEAPRGSPISYHKKTKIPVDKLALFSPAHISNFWALINFLGTKWAAGPSQPPLSREERFSGESAQSFICLWACKLHSSTRVASDIRQSNTHTIPMSKASWKSKYLLWGRLSRNELKFRADNHMAQISPHNCQWDSYQTVQSKLRM